MATEKPRFTITMDESLLSEVDNFKFEHRIKNQSKAIVELVKMGMDALAAKDAEAAEAIKKASEAELPASEANENPHIQMFADVLSRAGLLDDTGDLSDSDLEFLQAMLLALKAHFKDRKKHRN